MSLSLSLLGWSGISFEGILRAEPPPLPGPGLEVPVDLDGDGISTWGDRYAFNYWLCLGGDLAEALAEAKIARDTIDLSAFFLSARARLQSAISGCEGVPPSTAESAAGPSPLQAPCETWAVLHEAFQEEGAEQAYIVYCNPDLLAPYVAGHALNGQTIYLASEAIYQVSGFDDSGSGAVPLAQEQGSVFYSNPDDGPTHFWELQVDLTYGAAQLLATAWWRRPNGTDTYGVARFPIEDPGSWCEEASTGLSLTDALALLLEDRAGFGTRGRYYVSRTTGSEAVLQDTLVAGGCSAGGLVWKFFASGPSALALGTFDPTDPAYPFALYHTELIELSTKIVERIPPFSARRRTFDTGGFGPAALAFDPHSNTLFAASEWSVLRYRRDGTWVEFLSNLTGARGITFTWSGLLVVSEPEQLVGVDGWRYRFKRGDVDANLQINITDAIVILDWLNLSGPEPPCWDAADVNDDSAHIDISDAIYLLNYLFLGGPPPPPPYSDLPDEGFGADPTPDLFGCRQYHPAKEVTWP